MHIYEDLHAIKRARRLIPIVYRETANFPTDEKYGLTKQMRSCAISIGANVAEGAGRITRGEFRQFVSQASGSAYELEWHTLIATDLHYLKPQVSRALQREVTDLKKILYGLARFLADKPRPRPHDRPTG